MRKSWFHDFSFFWGEVKLLTTMNWVLRLGSKLSIEFETYLAQSLQQKKYAELEEMGARILARRRTYASGNEESDVFVNEFIGVKDGNVVAYMKADKLWTLSKSISEWISARPSSPLPRIILAHILYQLGWDARGHAYIDKVSEEGKRLWMEREAKALRILYDARNLKNSYPFFWKLEMCMMTDQGKRGTLEAAFSQSQIMYPGYYPAYSVKANALQERWLGLPGEWTQWAQAAADKIGGPAGDLLYCRIINSIDEIGYYCKDGETVFDLFEIDWPRVLRGFQQMKKTYPEQTVWIISRQARLAVKKKDYAVARSSFSALAGTVDAETWTVTSFQDARDKAFYGR